MEEFLIRLFENVSGFPSYAIVFGVLLACGLGVPLPEDVSLILGGFLSYEGKAHLPWMMVTGMLGILAGDSLIFYAGRRVGSRVGAQPKGLLARVVTPEKRAKVAKLFERHGEKIVMIARFLPGVRAVTYFTAGSVHMKYRRFIFFDGLAALVSAPVFVYLGYYFGGELHLLLQKLRTGQTRVFIVLGALIALYVGFKVWRRRRQKAAEAAQARALPVDGAAPTLAAPTEPARTGGPLEP